MKYYNYSGLSIDFQFAGQSLIIQANTMWQEVLYVNLASPEIQFIGPILVSSSWENIFRYN